MLLIIFLLQKTNLEPIKFLNSKAKINMMFKCENYDEFAQHSTHESVWAPWGLSQLD